MYGGELSESDFKPDYTYSGDAGLLPTTIKLQGISNTTAEQIAATIGQCFVRSCQNDPTCTDSQTYAEAQQKLGTIQFLENNPSLVTIGLCGTVPARIDPDIGGIGVSTGHNNRS